MYLTPGNI